MFFLFHFGCTFLYMNIWIYSWAIITEMKLKWKMTFIFEAKFGLKTTSTLVHLYWILWLVIVIQMLVVIVNFNWNKIVNIISKEIFTFIRFTNILSTWWLSKLTSCLNFTDCHFGKCLCKLHHCFSFCQTGNSQKVSLINRCTRWP